MELTQRFCTLILVSTFGISVFAKLIRMLALHCRVKILVKHWQVSVPTPITTHYLAVTAYLDIIMSLKPYVRHVQLVLSRIWQTLILHAHSALQTLLQQPLDQRGAQPVQQLHNREPRPVKLVFLVDIFSTLQLQVVHNAQLESIETLHSQKPHVKTVQMELLLQVLDSLPVQFVLQESSLLQDHLHAQIVLLGHFQILLVPPFVHLALLEQLQVGLDKPYVPFARVELTLRTQQHVFHAKSVHFQAAMLQVPAAFVWVVHFPHQMALHLVHCAHLKHMRMELENLYAWIALLVKLLIPAKPPVSNVILELTFLEQVAKIVVLDNIEIPRWMKVDVSLVLWESSQVEMEHQAANFALQENLAMTLAFSHALHVKQVFTVWLAGRTAQYVQLEPRLQQNQVNVKVVLLVSSRT
jgi:hypothetical protein